MIGLLMLAAAATAEPTIVPSGGFVSGNQLKEWCDSQQTACISYVEGVVDGAMFYKAWGAPKAKFCIPPNVTMGQLRDIAVQFLTEHPETRHYGAASLIVTSLYGAFPCPA